MEESESPEGGSMSKGSSGGHLGVNKAHSAKISKVVKRSIIQPPKPQAPVYTIDKNDFRNIVQKLTGSPTPTEPPPPPPVPPPVSSLISPPPPPQTNPTQNKNQQINPTQNQNHQQSSRLQRVKPPPLQSVQSFNKLVSNLTPMTNIPLPSSSSSYSSRHHNHHHSLPPVAISSSSDNFTTASVNSFAFRPTPTPAQVPAFRFPGPSGQFSTTHFQFPQHSNFNASFSRPQPLMAEAPPPPSQPQFLAFSPLPSPSSQYPLGSSFGGSQVPFSPGSIFPLSPSGQFGYPGVGAGPLPPVSPGSFPLSPGQFPFTSF